MEAPGKTLKGAGRYSALCRPDEEKSCFRCCPPIRPAGYDHLDHRASLARFLRENTRDFAAGPPRQRIITGYSCWGLGYLDREEKTAGCLLHPGPDHGPDLRDLTGYGDKCRREICREAEIYSRLTTHLAAFLTNLASGLDTFEYSSPRANPMFRLLRFGPTVIEALSAEHPEGLTREVYLERWKILSQELDPDRDGFALEFILKRRRLADLAEPDFLSRYKQTSEAFISRHRVLVDPPMDNRPFVHQLELDPAFVRFLRVLGFQRAVPSSARRIQAEFEAALAKLC